MPLSSRQTIPLEVGLTWASQISQSSINDLIRKVQPKPALLDVFSLYWIFLTIIKSARFKLVYLVASVRELHLVADWQICQLYCFYGPVSIYCWIVMSACPFIPPNIWMPWKLSKTTWLRLRECNVKQALSCFWFEKCRNLGKSAHVTHASIGSPDAIGWQQSSDIRFSDGKNLKWLKMIE